MIPERGDHSAMGKAISDDISKLYFNLIPLPPLPSHDQDSEAGPSCGGVDSYGER